MRPLLPLLLCALVACGAGPRDRSPEDRSPGPRLARFHVVGPEADVLAAELKGSRFTHRVLSRLEGWESGVERGLPGTSRAAFTMVVGTLPLPAEARELAAALPVELGEELRFDGTTYPGRAALALRLPEGAAADWLVVGGEPEAVADLAARVAGDEVPRRAGAEAGWGRRSLGLASTDYLLQGTPYLSRRGRFRTTEDGAREVDPAHDEDEPAERARALDGMGPVGGDDGPVGELILRAPPDRRGDPTLVTLERDLERALGGMAGRLGLGEVLRTHPVTAVLLPDFETQGRYAGALGRAVPGDASDPADPDLFLVIDPATDAADLFLVRHALAQVLLRRALDAELATGKRPAPPPWLLDGAALLLSGDWYGRPWTEWPPLLEATGALPSADQLLAHERTADASEVLWPPAAAWVVSRLPGATMPDRLLSGVDAATISQALTAVPDAPTAPSHSPSSPSLPSFLRGVSFAMANGLDSGYHARSADRMLARLATLGTDAVSLMPFAFQEDPAAPGLRYLNDSPGSETDVGLLHAARRARERGMTVLWKPQIWLRGSWTGEVRMPSDAAWADWWDGYRRYVLHHAVLAAHARAEVFSVGVELGRTLDREREWRDLIAAVRRLYPGLVTYSANWHGDAEHAPFWDALDFVGVDAYYPLTDTAEPVSGEALRRGARAARDRLAALAREHGKPVLLTEVGFAARRFAWHAPHEEGGEPSAEDQARAYQALLGELGKPEWLAGVFVWKAFSSQEREVVDDRPDFRFLERPAAAVVSHYFGNKAEP